ncbi:MAG: peptidylprolyl isomerase, partial [Deltaproteobacteria bacterium]
SRREAVRAGMRTDADSGEAGRKRMVQGLVVRRFHDPEGPKTIPDADVRAYYEEHRDRYDQPVKTRLAHIVLECPEGSPRRPARAREAARLRERIVGDRASDPDPFRSAMEAITRAGDPETQAIFLGLVSQQDLGDFLPAVIVKAAWDLGPEAPSPVLSSPRGFHLLQNYGGQPALRKTLEQARGEIQIILYQARMAEAYRQWRTQLRESARVRIDKAELARVRVDPGSPPTLTPAGPAGR